MASLFINYLLKYPKEGTDRSMTRRVRINTAVYQAICTNVIVEGNTYTVYGIQMLSGKPGHYFIVDEIQDIAIQADRIFQIVDLLNYEKVADVHFKDVVMDSIL